MSTFLSLQQRLGRKVGLDQTISSEATVLKDALNAAQATILRAFEWPFNRSSTPLVIQTVVPYTTGTVATVAGSASVTFSGTIAASKVGYYLQTVDSKDWYLITAHTAGTATATIEVPALSSNAAATFSIYKRYYSTSASVDTITEVSQEVLPYQLIETSEEYFKAFNPGFLSSGTPRIYCMAGSDASGYPQFRLWPNPDAAINLYVTYQKVPVDLSADGDIPVVPAKFERILLKGAESDVFTFLDDARADISDKKFYDGIEEMKGEYENSTKRHRVMTAADNQPVGGNLGYMPLPFNYPRSS